MNYNKKILVVDDESGYRELAAKILRRAGHTVYTAENGEEAIGLAREHQPGVVIIDYRMRETNGFDVAKQLRSLDHGYDPGIILMTGSKKEALEENPELRTNFANYFDDLLEKPFEQQGLLGKVNGVIQRRSR